MTDLFSSSPQQCRHQPCLSVSHTQLSGVVATECKHRTIFCHAHGVNCTRRDLQHFPALQSSLHQYWHHSGFCVPNTQPSVTAIAAHKHQTIYGQTRQVPAATCTTVLVFNNPVTNVGTTLFSVPPPPSWPCSILSHANALPPALTHNVCSLPHATRVCAHGETLNLIGSAALTVSRSSGHDTTTMLTLYFEALHRISPPSPADNDRFQHARCVACSSRTSCQRSCWAGMVRCSCSCANIVRPESAPASCLAPAFGRPEPHQGIIVFWLRLLNELDQSRMAVEAGSHCRLHL